MQLGQLVFTRKRHGAVMIGDDIEITVLSVRAGRVRLGIIAPPGVSVHRLEVWKRIAEERLEDGSAPPLRPPSERRDVEAA